MRTKHFYLPESEAAELIGSTPRGLAYCRANGGGPRFLRLGRRIYYRLSDLACWARLNKNAPPEWFDRFDRRHFPDECLSSAYEFACRDFGPLGFISLPAPPPTNFFAMTERNRRIDEALIEQTLRRSHEKQ